MKLKLALAFTAGVAIGMGIAVYMALSILQAGMIMPGPSIWGGVIA